MQDSTQGIQDRPDNTQQLWGTIRSISIVQFGVNEAVGDPFVKSAVRGEFYGFFKATIQS